MTGDTYYERGEPVVVLASWCDNMGQSISRQFQPESMIEVKLWLRSPHKRSKTGPRNVLIRRKDGELVVRPFRGLRKLRGRSAVTE